MLSLKRICGVIPPRRRAVRFRRYAAWAAAAIVGSGVAVPVGQANALSVASPDSRVAAAPRHSVVPQGDRTPGGRAARSGGITSVVAVTGTASWSSAGRFQELETTAPAAETPWAARGARFAVRVLIATSAVLLTIAGLGLLLPVLAGVYLVVMGVGVAVLAAVRRNRAGEAEGV